MNIAGTEVVKKLKHFECCTWSASMRVSINIICLVNDCLLVTEANMLYLESPAGVGFSYSANESFYDFVTDEMTGSFYA